MPSKLQFYSEFAERTARQITGSYRSWTAFLATAARLYKYPYNEQLMIYAQRPNATACAEYDFWKDRMGRYVQRGSTGIALIDTSGYQPRLRYVFDVADTAPRDAARSFTLWEMRAEHEAKVCSMLTEQYDVPQDGGIIAQFERVADKLALEYWTEQKRDICDIVADSFLNGYDEDNIRMAFKTAASTSITYALMARCGFSPDGYFEPEDFMPVFDFNTPAAVSVLGTAVSEISQRVLRQIEITVKRHERERRAERTEEHGEQPDLQDQRRISDPRPEPARESAEPAAWQIRTDAANVSPGASSDPLESDDPDGNAFSAPAGDRRSGEPEVGADDAGADDVGRSDGSAESSRPIEVGRSDEHLQGASRGSDPRGADLRITEPVQGEQISFMPEAENVQTSSASPVLDYNSIKEMHPDDIVLYQVGDFFEIYGEDAKQAASLLDMNLTTRNIPGAGRVEMCGLPSHNLEMYVEKLRDKYDVTIAEASDFRGERHIYTLRSIDHEAEAAINAYEAEFGADGTRMFRDPAAEQVQPTVQERLEHYRPVVMAAVSEDTAYRNACGHSDRENAEIECNAAVRRAILGSKDMELITMNTETINTQLYEKMFAEQERYRDWLLHQPPEEILNHAYEYAIREDILMALESRDLSFMQAQMLIFTATPLADILKEFDNRETDHMDVIRNCCETRADAMLKLAQECPAYCCDASYAKSHGEIEQYRNSFWVNMECKSMIENAIVAAYMDNSLKDVQEASKAVIDTFGFHRTMFVLANTIRIKSYDGRISPENKAWAQTIPACGEQQDILVDRCNPGLLDLFTNQVRKDFAAEQQHSQQKVSVREKLHGTPARAAERSASSKRDRDAR